MSKNDLILALDVVVWGFVVIVLVGCAIAVWRILWGPRQLVVPDRELEVNVHDWNCDTGPWPHDGDCTVNGDDYGRYVSLARGVSVGIGRLPGDPNEPVVVERRYRLGDADQPSSKSDERCEGAGA